MMETNITIALNNKEDIENVELILKGENIQAPIVIVELRGSFQISFKAEYEYFELDDALALGFEDYELTADVGVGTQEIKMQIHRWQSFLPFDDWGQKTDRPPLDKTTYLVKKQDEGPTKFNPNVRVLFGEDERVYRINIAPGRYASSETRGYFLLDSFEDVSNEDINAQEDLIVGKLHESLSEAFWAGINRLESHVETEYEKYRRSKKKRRK